MKESYPEYVKSILSRITRQPIRKMRKEYEQASYRRENIKKMIECSISLVISSCKLV